MVFQVTFHYPEKGSDENINPTVLEPAEVIEEDYIIERILDYNRMALDVAGEWTSFFKIKQSGDACPCREKDYQQSVRPDCPLCYGVGWLGGYDYCTYDNDNSQNPYVKDNNKFLVRIIRDASQIELTQNIGLTPKQIPHGFCLAPPYAPQVLTRDIIIPGFTVDRAAIDVVQSYPVVRGEDLLPNEVINDIMYIKNDLNNDWIYDVTDFYLNANQIVWTGTGPTMGSTYYVTYEKMVQYPNIYQVGPSKIPTIRGIATHQSFDLTELPKTHPAYLLLNVVR